MFFLGEEALEEGGFVEVLGLRLGLDLHHAFDASEAPMRERTFASSMAWRALASVWACLAVR